ncbi:hypothetical protein OOT00_07460 [Desulfobotulus sp. H1]|uniref:PKD/Chitinase domain-containing protein n=1 Tax=Desulfobotulus pelophilus TaxID=2823377 RepID=A0ABT3N8N9_9BACT|nr:choice-of-anchor U domain-containing protein [Desulfobotulus pelophilus]MCW7753817.1 hypothetical protein [Desulfobotulus pelophilus]
MARFYRTFFLAITLLLSLTPAQTMAADPVVTISTPADGSQIIAGSYVSFLGSAVIAPGQTITEYQWASSRDGVLSSLQTFGTQNLSPGLHTITLLIRDDAGKIGTHTITLTIINTAPQAHITQPDDGAFFFVRQHIRFEGYGDDAEDGRITNDDLRWVSDRNGFLGTGPTLDIGNLTAGHHTISLTAMDSHGMISPAARIQIEVRNEPPVAVIHAPADGSSFNLGEAITLSGSAHDPEDGPLTGSDLSWSSSKDGTIGTGEELRNVTLSSGEHHITLTARDKDGKTGNDTITIIAGNHPPVAEILSPGDGQHFMAGETIEFRGQGTDREDGLLPDIQMVWTSGRDGEIGTGRSFETNTLSDGRHDIRLTVKDKDGGSHTAQISITCGNTPPSIPVIYRPLPDAVFEKGETVVFYGTAQDTEDGNLSGSSLTWQSNNGGQITNLGSGNSFSTNSLASGDHSISLKATDSGGASSTQTVNVTVKEMKADIPRPQLRQGLMQPVSIQGGTGPYRIAIRHPQLLSCQVSRETANSLSLNLTGLSSGSTTLTITDSIRNTVTLQVLIISQTSPQPVAKARIWPASGYSGEKFQLSAEGSTGSDAAIQEYIWTQTQGPPVFLLPGTGMTTRFMAPPVSMNTTLGFQILVRDANGLEATHKIHVTISPSSVSMPGIPDNTIPIRSIPGPPVAIMQTPGLTDFSVHDPDDIRDMNNRPPNLPYGLFRMAMEAGHGETAKFILYLPEPAPRGSSWMKYHPVRGWVDFDRHLISAGQGDGAVFNHARDQVFIYITDNGPWDTNPAPGIVEDPSGLALPVTAPPSSGDTAGSGGGGGCFMSSIFFPE